MNTPLDSLHWGPSYNLLTLILGCSMFEVKVWRLGHFIPDKNYLGHLVK